MKARGLRPRAFICFSVFGTRDEALALVFDILLLNQIEDAVAYVFYQDNALLRSGKPAERTSVPLVRPLAVFLDLKLILFS